MEQAIVDLVLKNGLACMVMALIVMTLVGIVKIFTKGVVEKKVVTDNQKKWLAKLYLGLALVFSFVVNIFYRWLIIDAPVWTLGLIRDAGLTWTATAPLYQLYKQFGGRRLLIAVTALLAEVFKGKNKNADEIIDVIMAILEKDAPLLTDVQKEAIKNDLSGSLEIKSTEK